MDEDENDELCLEVSLRHVDRGEARITLTWPDEKTTDELRTAAADLVSTLVELHRTTLRKMSEGSDG